MGMADDWVSLGMALVIIALVSLGMYSFASRAHTVGSSVGKGFDYAHKRPI